MSFKVGLGYDIHRFASGKKLVLGGVQVPYDKGLEGHSDADVLLHAVCDALLGALGKGDIGEHFPNTDPAYKGIESAKLLSQVYNLVKSEGYSVGNVDCMIQAEEPNLKKYKEDMIKNISELLAISVDNVNVKATTQERLGAIGNKEGIAAFATVLIKRD